MKFAVSVAAILSLACLTGCKSNAKQGEASPQDQRTAAVTIDPATLGSISGTVHISGTVPNRIKIDMSQDPACTLGSDNMTEQIVAKDGNLANVFVYIKEAPSSIASGTQLPPVVIDQKGCRFTPHVAAIYKGGTVEFTNSDPTMHNVHMMPVQVGNTRVDVSQGPNGKPQDERFNTAETMIPLLCNNHPWMNGFLNVSPTPYFAVSGPDGSFKIPSVPAGKYTLVFVHEKLGTQELPITITAHQATPATITFTSKS